MSFDDICYVVEFFDGEDHNRIRVGSSDLASILVRHGLDSGYDVRSYQENCNPDDFVLR